MTILKTKHIMQLEEGMVVMVMVMVMVVVVVVVVVVMFTWSCTMQWGCFELSPSDPDQSFCACSEAIRSANYNVKTTQVTWFDQNRESWIHVHVLAIAQNRHRNQFLKIATSSSLEFSLQCFRHFSEENLCFISIYVYLYTELNFEWRSNSETSETVLASSINESCLSSN